MLWSYDRAEKGKVVLTGGIDLLACQGSFLIALVLGRDEYDAAHRARASLLQGFDAARKLYIEEWQTWQNNAGRILKEKGDAHVHLHAREGSQTS